MKLSACIPVVLAIVPGLSLADPAVLEQLKATYPQATVETIAPGPVDGLYEVVAGQNVFYYAPDQDLLLFGEFFTAEGGSLTAQRRQAITTQQASWQTASPSQATLIRPGEDMLTAYLDVNCGHCARFVDWVGRADLPKTAGIEVVFVSFRAADAQKAAHVVCNEQAQRESALREVFERDPDTHWNSCESSDAVLQGQARMAADAGVRGTPAFVFNEQTVLGFNPERLSALLNETGETPGVTQ